LKLVYVQHLSFTDEYAELLNEDFHSLQQVSVALLVVGVEGQPPPEHNVELLLLKLVYVQHLSFTDE
jgi:hypothetical protein